MEHVAAVWFMALSLVSLGSSQTVTSPAFTQGTFAKIGGSNKRYAHNPDALSIEVSPAACGLRCFMQSYCVSFNLRKESQSEFTCELLSYIPLSPTASLQDSPDWNYYEKGCSSSYNVVAAADGPVEGVEMTTGQTAVSVATDGGRYIYTAIFNNEFTLVRLQYGLSLATVEGGLFLYLDSIVKVKMAASTDRELVSELDSELDIFTQGNQINVTIRPYNLCAQGFPKPLQDVGASGARALLIARDSTDVLAFRQGEVVVLALNFAYPDEVTMRVKEILKVGRNETHKWRLAPPDVTSAAWLRSKDAVDSSDMAFLATPDFYVILNATSGAVVKRDRLCRPRP